MTADDPQNDLVAEAARLAEEWGQKPPADRSDTIGRLGSEVERAFRSKNPELVDATELDRWSERRGSAGQLPELIRRLVGLSPGVDRFSARSGDGIALRGWDLLVHANPGDAFVPLGQSAWELTVDAKPRQKAASDYLKRTENPLGLDPSTTTLVFVSLRRWPGKDEWAAEKSSSGPWREVRALDADDIEAWLQTRPSVHYWVSAILGKRPDAVQPLDQWWQGWSAETDPPIPPDLVTAGRLDVAKEFYDWSASESAILVVQADTIEESTAFVASALLTAEPDRQVADLERTVVVKDPTAWPQIASSTAPLVLIPLAQDVEVGLALAGGHRVVLPTGRDLATRGQVLSLPRIRRGEARDALVKAGTAERLADELSLLATRSLMAFRRRTAISPVLRKPAWARPGDGLLVAQLMLLGKWSRAKDGDHEAIEAVTGCPYSDVERQATAWSLTDDPPVRRLGTTWSVSSKEDLWLLVGRLLPDRDLESFRNVAVRVLTELDPTLQLEPDRRFMSAVLGIERRWSAELRRSLADTCAFLGGRAAQHDQMATPASAEAALVVDRVLAWANEDPSCDGWASLSEVLPLLAEAAPDQFLAHLDASLAGDDPPMRRLFRDSESSSVHGGSSPHTGLLWALEALSWNRELLGRTATALAALANLDPGGRLTNRPIASLRDIFLVYQPHTTAPLDDRLEVLDAIRVRYPDVAWLLLLRLLPGRHDWWSPTAAPRWRDWRPDAPGTATVAEVVAVCETVVTRLIHDAGLEGERWGELVNRYADLPETSRALLKAALDDVSEREISPPDQMRVWSAINELNTKHRQFPDAAWSLSPNEIAELESLQQQFTAPPANRRLSELFDYAPKIPGVDRFGDDYHAAVARAQAEAIREVLSESGIDGVIRVAEDSALPELVGRALADVDGGLGDKLLPMLDAFPESAAARAASGYSGRCIETSGWQWAMDQLNSDAQQWSASAVAGVLLSTPVTAEVLDSLAAFDDDVQSDYWNRVSSYRVPAPLVPDVVPKLLEYGRPWSAISTLSLTVGTSEAGQVADVDLVAGALESAAFTPADEAPDYAGVAHDVSVLLDVLESVKDGRSARYEFAFLKVLQDSRQPVALHRRLSSDASFFTEIVCHGYRASDSDPEQDLTDAERTMAEMAHTLLLGWHTLPGVRADGSVDDAQLRGWVDDARRGLTEAGRTSVADSVIGEALSASPPGADGIWPCEAVREVVEVLRSEQLDNGLQIGRINARGVVVRDPLAGGEVERQLATAYRSDASKLSARWPRSAAVLRGLADSYEQEARWHDESAERWLDHE